MFNRIQAKMNYELLTQKIMAVKRWVLN